MPTDCYDNAIKEKFSQALLPRLRQSIVDQAKAGITSLMNLSY